MTKKIGGEPVLVSSVFFNLNEPTLSGMWQMGGHFALDQQELK
jgi:hypothetical protein